MCVRGMGVDPGVGEMHPLEKMWGITYAIYPLPFK